MANCPALRVIANYKMLEQDITIHCGEKPQRGC